MGSLAGEGLESEMSEAGGILGPGGPDLLIRMRGRAVGAIVRGSARMRCIGGLRRRSILRPWANEDFGLAESWWLRLF